jgi:3'-5' exoribonuclease
VARTGDPYLVLDFGDRAGRLGGVMFRPDDAALEAPSGTVVRVSGVVTSYRGVRRLEVRAMEATSDYDRDDLVAGPVRDTCVLLGCFEYLRGEIGEPSLRVLVERVLSEPGTMERFVEAPASTTRHHAYRGGLLEHTVAVATTCQHVAQVYERVDADLLLAAALLHDVGKIDELAFDTYARYTDQGRLVGHVVLGERRVARAAESLVGMLADEVRLKLSHAILSHHGELEWGAPKRPSTLEALLLHHVDNLDAKLAGFSEAARHASAVDEPWTDVKNLFRRPLYVPRPLQADRELEPEEDDEYAALPA